MKLAKRPIDPNLQHYAVSIDVVNLGTGDCRNLPSVRVAAVSIEQAIRKAGMQTVQRLKRREKGKINNE